MACAANAKGSKALARFPNDKLLNSLAGLPIGPLRLWAARKAADRSLHWAALRGGSTDPYVLARLGLFPQALDQKATDATGRIGQSLAAAALGNGGPSLQAALTSMSRSRRKQAAKLIALSDCDGAIALLAPDDFEAIAACLLALDRQKDARSQIDRLQGQTRETAAIAAHIAICAGDYGEARQALNAMFAQDGLSAALDVSSDAFGIDDLRSAAQETQDGPKISIVVPFHNAAATLDSAVRSLTVQSWRNIEILLVDDRSSDDGPAVAKRLAEADPRVIPLSNRRKAGVYGARNSAIEAATGDFVTFLDADDWSPAERLACQMGAIGARALTIANHIRMDEAGRPVAPRIFPLVRPVPITMLLRRETLIAAGPFEEVETGADSEMLARLEMAHGKSGVARDPAVLLVARWRSGSLSREKEGGLLGLERHAYRADWMFRHAGLDALRLPAEPGAA